MVVALTKSLFRAGAPEALAAPLDRARQLREESAAAAARLHRWDAHLNSKGGAAAAGAAGPSAAVGVGVGSVATAAAAAAESGAEAEARRRAESAAALTVLSADAAAPPRVLVVYVYEHTDWRLANLEFFLRHGLVAETHDGAPVDYTFVFNGEAPLDALQERGLRYAVAMDVWQLRGGGGDGARRRNSESPDGGGEDRPGVPGQPLISVVLRERIGLNMCAWRLTLEEGWAPRPGNYTRVVLMAASMRGPFMPSFAHTALTWVDAFTSEGASMVGATINCMPARRDAATGAFSSLHVQTSVLALDRSALVAVLPVLHCYNEAIEAIAHGEVGSTQAVLAAGLAVAALQGSWRGLAVRAADLATHEVARRCAAVADEAGGDPSLGEGRYLSGELHPFETVFVKADSGAEVAAVERLTRMSNSY